MNSKTNERRIGMTQTSMLSKAEVRTRRKMHIYHEPIASMRS